MSSSHAGPLLAFGVATLLFASPLRRLWVDEGLGWTTPFLVWGGVVALTAWASRRA